MSEQLANLAVLYKLLHQHLWKTFPVIYMELYHCEYSNCYLWTAFCTSSKHKCIFSLEQSYFNISAIGTFNNLVQGCQTGNPRAGCITPRAPPPQLHKGKKCQYVI